MTGFEVAVIVAVLTMWLRPDLWAGVAGPLGLLFFGWLAFACLGLVVVFSAVGAMAVRDFYHRLIATRAGGAAAVGMAVGGWLVLVWLTQ
jgi:hypothetical protein